MERKLTAILAADVAGYSRLVQADEAGTIDRLNTLWNDPVNTAISAHKGRVVKMMGDGVLVEFPSVVGAVECAVAIQRAMENGNRDIPAERRIEFRIGVNLGEVVVEGDDILGHGVNVAARLEEFAAPNTVCVSRSVYEQVKDRLDFGFEDCGEQRFKNVAEPIGVFQVKPDGGAPPFGEIVPAGEELPLPDKPSIAILPFQNLSRDPDQDYLADGLRLDIQAMLIKLSGLFLIAPSAMAQFRGRDVPPEQVAGKLGVRYILGGAVQKAGDRVRIVVELTDTVARRVVWAEQYDRVPDDTFGVQDEITVEVVKALDVKLASGEKTFMESTLKTPQALDCFYRGLHRFYSGTKQDNAEARIWFEKVAQLQTDSPVGATYLCFSHWMDAFRGWAESKEEATKEAARWGEKALKFGHSNGFAHIVLASIELLNGHYDEALAAGREAMARRPNCPTANGYLAYVMHYCGHSREAIARIRDAMRLTPAYPPWFVDLLAAAYRDSGDVGNSISAAEHCLRLNPDDLEARVILCADYNLAGQREKARSLAGEIVGKDPAFSVSRYAETQPYRDKTTLRRLVENLHEAGLPQ